MNDIAVPQAAAIGPGTRLAAARESQGLSVSEAAAALKLSPRQIEALESDSYERLPGAIFVRGFLRSYARLLKLDPAPVLRSAESLLGTPAAETERAPAPETPFPERRRAAWRGWALLGGVVLLGLSAYEVYLDMPQPQRVQPRPAAVTQAAPEPAQQGQAEPSRSAEPAPQARSAAVVPSAAESATSSAPAPGGAAPPAPSAAETAPAAPAAAPAVSAARGEHVLDFAFDRDSWVELRDGSGKVIESGLNRAGTQHSVSVRLPASLVIGNAAGVRMSVDGEPYDVRQHIKVDVARFGLK